MAYRLIKEKKFPIKKISARIIRIPEDAVPTVYTVPEAAKMIDVSTDVLYQKIASGELKVVNYGVRLTRIREDDLRKLMTGDAKNVNDK